MVMYFIFYVDVKRTEENMEENIKNFSQDSQYSGYNSTLNFLKCEEIAPTIQQRHCFIIIIISDLKLGTGLVFNTSRHVSAKTQNTCSIYFDNQEIYVTCFGNLACQNNYIF
jgi:hypothetical protein